MKYANAIAMSGIMVWVAGCASAPKVVVQEPVGPCQRVAAEGARDGSLQVYSARERAPLDLNAEVFFWNNDFGQNGFLYGAAHTGYTIFAQNGTVFEQVRNARNLNDGQPALVRLPPGRYSIEAEAEVSGGITIAVVVPLVIEAGQTTRVHLEPMRTPSGEAPDTSRLVRLADGRIIGCRAEHLLGQNLQSAVVTQP